MTRESIEGELEVDGHYEAAAEAVKASSTCRLRRRTAMIVVGGVAFISLIIAVISISIGESHTKSKSVGSGGNNTYTLVQHSEVFTADGTLPAFNHQVLGGYDLCKDLEADIITALKDLAYSTIQQQKNHDHSWCYYTFYNAASAESSDKGTSSESSGNAVTTESSYETNNQVKGVDEADMVKSDGTYIFAGYGNEVIVTDLNGTIVTRISVPDVPHDKPTSEDSSSTASAKIPPYYYIPPTRQVQALLLYNGILTVITYYDNWYYENVMSGGNTTAFLYKFDPKDSTLTLTSQIDMTGYFSGGRSVGSNMYIVTNAYINTWTFTQNFSRCNEEFKNLSAEDYEKAALLAVSGAAAAFGHKLMEAILMTPNIDTTSSCKNIIRISTMSNQNLTEISEQRRLGAGMWFYDQGLLQNFIQLTSFDVDQGSLAAIKSNSAGAFSAGYSPQIYATEDRLVLASQSYRYEPISGNEASYNEYTYLLTFDLSGSVATPSSIGEVDGYLNDQYSMDYFNGFYRIATTIRQKWGSSYNEASNTYTWESISESTSQVYVLEEKSSGLEIAGAVKDLGKGEVIQSVRFLGDKGYVVTFQQVDPLFIIDFSSPTEPVVSGELKTTGFSQYMHPIKNDNFLLTVGQEATTEGQITGIKFSVFNVTDPTTPFEVQKYVVENGEGWASTDASWDYHAFRYLDQSEILIVPENIYNWENPSKSLDGFVVYKIDLVHGIMPLGNVTHANYEYMQYYCWGSSYLPSRSMVFNGDLVTFKSHSVMRSSTVETLKVKVWELNLDEGRNKSQAYCYKYGPWVY